MALQIQAQYRSGRQPLTFELESGARYLLERRRPFFRSATLRDDVGTVVAGYEYPVFRRNCIAIPGRPDLPWCLGTARGAHFAYRFFPEGESEFQVPIRGKSGINLDLTWRWSTVTFGTGRARLLYKLGKGYSFEAQLESDELPAVILAGFLFWDVVMRFE